MNNQTIQAQKVKYPHLSLLLEELQLQYESKLWHEATDNLL